MYDRSSGRFHTRSYRLCETAWCTRCEQMWYRQTDNPSTVLEALHRCKSAPCSRCFYLPRNTCKNRPRHSLQSELHLALLSPPQMPPRCDRRKEINIQLHTEIMNIRSTTPSEGQRAFSHGEDNSTFFKPAKSLFEPHSRELNKSPARR